MNALTLVFASLCIFAIGYRFYGLFFARKVLRVDENRLTPAVKMADGVDYVETNKYVLFGHHFAAIAAAGPLLGPVLAAQFGYMPGALWILIGCVLGGAVHDTVALFASIRHKGKSLAYIATQEVDKLTGTVASFVVLSILVLALAGLSIAMVNAMFKSPWGTFTVFATIPIAILMGLWIFRWRPGDVLGGSIMGVALLAVALWAGPHVAASPTWAPLFNLSMPAISLAIPIYGVLASVLPVWLLLCPRDYLSTYLKVGTIFFLALGIFWVHPELQMPAFTEFTHGGGPIIPGPVFPFLFITIACGAISGFHSLIGSGTTPKMLDSERNLLFVSYGAMLLEGFVAIMALVAACTMVPADYFVINSAPAAFAKLGMTPVHLDSVSQAVGETLAGRPGGAVSLAVGMAQIFGAIPLMQTLVGYWYHFAIMFEAVFILTAIDAGTRVGRFILQEMLGHVYPRFNDKRWWPGVIFTSLLFTGAWGYLVYTGNITTIWPVFGIFNQLLAAMGLFIGTTMLIRMNKAKYAWTTGVPGVVVAFITLWASFLNMTLNLWPKGLYLLLAVSIVTIILTVIVMFGSVRRWIKLLQIKTPVTDAYGEQVLEVVQE